MTSPLDRPQVSGNFVEPALAGWAHLVYESLSGSKIYLGPQNAAAKICGAALSRAMVTAIVNCTNVFPNHHISINYCRIAVNDECGANILIYLKGAVRFIHHHLSRGESVLVQCQMGVSRSATVVIAYLMKYQSLSREEAYQHIKQKRPMIHPNPGFWDQLKVYENRILKEATLPQQTGALFSATTAFDKEWAEASLATFQTIGNIIKDKSELFREISTSKTDISKVLFVSVDYIFGRGIQEADLPWLGALCAMLSAHDPDCNVMKMIDSLFLEGSEFHEMWSGEIYPCDVERIKKAVASTTMEG